MYCLKSSFTSAGYYIVVVSHINLEIIILGTYMKKKLVVEKSI
jgi:hypothetical protein